MSKQRSHLYVEEADLQYLLLRKYIAEKSDQTVEKRLSKDLEMGRHTALTHNQALNYAPAELVPDWVTATRFPSRLARRYTS